ncbi:MAG: hypothetical protein LBT98_02850 [Puniceicoccales bacterium]|nr:hypothetical protein [Puniceicoccales bacterium]
MISIYANNNLPVGGTPFAAQCGVPLESPVPSKGADRLAGRSPSQPNIPPGVTHCSYVAFSSPPKSTDLPRRSCTFLNGLDPRTRTYGQFAESSRAAEGGAGAVSA